MRKEANLAKLYLPDPPTPISIAFPLGCLSILATLKTCSKASSKKTRSILSLVAKEYSSYFSSRALTIIFLFSVTSSYTMLAASNFKMSENKIYYLKSSSSVQLLWKHLVTNS